MQNVVEANAIKTDKGLLFKTEEHYLIAEFTVAKDAWYDMEINYCHDDWEAYVRLDITYPTGENCGFMQGLLHGRRLMVFPVYLKTGTNKINIRHHHKDNTEIFGINLKGESQNLNCEISPKNNVLFKDNKTKVKTFVRNYNDKLKSVVADKTVELAFECVNRDKSNGFSLAMEDVYLNSDLVYALTDGAHDIVYTFESGKTLKQNIEIKNTVPKSKLQIINFDVLQANSTLIMLPNGKNILVDSGTDKMAEERVIPYLKKNNIKIDYYLLTHFHKDHKGLKDDILQMNSIKVPDIKKCEKLVKATGKKRYKYLKKFGYLDSKMLCYYDEIHQIWDLGGVEITVSGSRYDENGNPTKEYHYSFIKNNEHNYENSTSVSFMLKYNGFGYYHSADNYGFCQDRYMSDMIKMGREKELDCHWFYANHHFINDINAKFINTLNPTGVFVPNNMLYRRAAYSYYYKENVENYCFSHKRLTDTLVSSQTGGAKVSVVSGDDWYYEIIDNENI